MELKGLKINFLGDSITEGVGTERPEQIYLNIIAKQEKLEIARNYGVGGTRIAKNRAKSVNCPIWDEDFITRAEQMDSDADMVVVFGGTNDYGHGDAPMGNISSNDPYTFYGALHTLIRLLMDKYVDKQLVFVTPIHRVEENKLINEAGIRNVGCLSDYVNAIKEVCKYYSVPVFDAYALSGIQPEVEILKQKYCPDGLHPNAEGHKLFARKLTEFLKTL